MYNLQELIKLRQDIHQNPEPGFKEYETQKKIIKYLVSKGISETIMNKAGRGTGLVIDIKGQGQSKGENKVIMFRADIDALEMDEENFDLLYRSTIKCAHMCGHDGHTVCLLGFSALLMENIKNVPSNKTLRLLFQPCEEGSPNLEWGAPEIIKEGWLDGVDEIYGFHNLPTHHLPGKLYVKSGPVMASITVISIKIVGKGGHGSAPELANDPVWPTIDILRKTKELIQKFEAAKELCRLSLPCVHCGTAKNVISETSSIQGTFRFLNDETYDKFEKEFNHFSQEICDQYGCQLELNLKTVAKCVKNTEKEADNVKRVALKYFGPENVVDGILPIYASEDFAYYTEIIPGAFFFLSSKKKETDDIMLHSSKFDFPDDLIDIGSQFWFQLAKDRLDF